MEQYLTSTPYLDEGAEGDRTVLEQSHFWTPDEVRLVNGTPRNYNKKSPQPSVFMSCYGSYREILIRILTTERVRIWNEWVDENGDLGPVYGGSGGSGIIKWQDNRPDQ